MTHFVPLAYVADTLTVWHLSVWLTIPALVGIVLPLRDGRPILWAWLPHALIMLGVVYGIIALLLGQLFGDTYSWSQLWPSGALLGGAFGALVFARSGVENRPPAAFALVGVALAAAFYAFGLWLLPRVVGFGLIDIPKAAWGVQL